jgi:hydroxypyruvate isomerase
MANKTRTEQVHFAVTAEEKEMIERRMAQAGVKNMRAYMLKQAIDGEIVHVELNSVKEMCRLLSNSTNNLNQIARRINQSGNLYAEDIADIQKHYGELWTQAKEILRRLSAL